MRIHVLFLLKNTPVRASRVIKACEELIENKKYSIALLAALSDIYNEQKELRKGVMCCRKMFALTEDPIIIAKIRFHIGYIYFINKYYKKMERVLAQAIKYDVVSPEVYNLLAYYYAQRGTNLSRALELVDNALQKEQYSPYFLDTKGVILLKMGKRLEALKIFERALTFAPTDKEILIHIRQARVG
jgi:tetratricopeptide (TPR) repeat protein